MGQFEKEIAGALKNTIDAHGPIDLDHVPSAAKRIKHALRESIKRERDAIARTTPRRSD
jgi:hypothetical protein